MAAIPMAGKNALRRGALFLAIAAGGNFIAYKIIHLPSQLELVILLTAAVFYPIVRKPVIGVYLLFSIMPFVSHLRRLYYLIYQRPVIDPLIAIGDAVIAITLIGLFFVFREQQQVAEEKVRIMSRVVLAYFAYCLIRTFFLNFLSVQEAVMQFHFFGPSVLFFYIGTLYANRMDILNRLWFITLGIGIVAAIYGIKQLFIGYSEAEQIWFSSISFTTLFIKGVARPFSFFQSPACFADYMIISIIGVFIISETKKTGPKILLLLLIPLYTYAALITSVRSNWIGIMLAFLLWIFFIQIRGARNRIIMILALGVLFIFYQILDFSLQYHTGINALFSIFGRGVNQERLTLMVTERTGAIINPFKEYSLLSRIALWKYIIVLSADPINAIFGRGTGTLNADSLYINYLAQFGYPGVIFIIWFIIIMIKNGFTLFDRSSSPAVVAMAKGITLMNIVFAVINLTGSHVHSFPGDVFFWFWNGVVVKLTAALQSDASSPQTFHP